MKGLSVAKNRLRRKIVPLNSIIKIATTTSSFMHGLQKEVLEKLQFCWLLIVFFYHIPLWFIPPRGNGNKNRFKSCSSILFIPPFKVNNRNTRKRCEICSKLTMKTPERRFGVFSVNFKHISHFFLVLLLLTLNK